jgi:DNA-binding response OmpR family regulator
MNNLQALIIEDDPKLANIFAQALRIVGFETESIQDLVLIKPIGFNQLRDLAKRLKPTQI